jgi:5'(3')-deoxyribonucleotidase
MKTFKNWLHDKKFTYVDAINMADVLGIDIKKYDPQEVVAGINVEREHGAQKKLNVISKKSDFLKIALAHLDEDPKYYKKLAKMEKNGKK